MSEQRDRLNELRAIKSQQAQAQPVAQPQAATATQSPRQRLEELRALSKQPQSIGGQNGISSDNTSSGSLSVDSQKPVITTPAQKPVQAEAAQDESLGQEVVGGLDTAKSILSSVVAEPIAGLAGLITSPFVGLDEATKNIDAVRQFITLEPSTPEGNRNLKAVGELVNKGVDIANFPVSGLVGIGEILSGQGIEQAAGSVEDVQKKGLSSTLGNRVFEETGSPELAAIAHSLPTAALELVGVKGLKSAKLKNEKLSSNVAEAITQAAPDLKAIQTKKTAAYNQLDNLGVKVKAQAFDSFADKINQRLINEGIDPTLTPKSTAALNRIMSAKGSNKSLSDLDTLRKIAKGAANDIDKTDARLGNIIIGEIDSNIEKLSSDIGGQFKEARGLAQRAFKSQDIQDMIENASHTASGMENGLRIEARKILKNPKRRKGFTSEELKALKSIEEGTTAANTAKFLGKFGISEQQATSMLGASIGAAGGGAIGSAFGPGGAAVGALTVPALGQFAKKAAQRITLNNTKFADDLVRSGKNSKEITKAYLKHTPVADRRVSDLTDLLLDTNLTPEDVKKLSSSKSTGGKLIADAVHFAQEVKRRAKQAGSAALIAQPELDQKETK